MLDRLGLLSLQAALFAKRMNLADPLSVAQGVNMASGNVFDGSPTILPLQEKTPPNVPLILLKSTDDKYTCNIASNRIDFRFNVQKAPPCNIRDIWDDYYATLKQITEYFCKKNPTPIWRLGLVSQFFVKLGASANSHILNTYIRPGIIEDTWDINVNFLSRFRMEQHDVNRWLKIRPIRNRKNPEDDSAMIAEIDINTLQESQKAFTQEEVDIFYEDAYLHIINQDIQTIILE